MPYRYLTRDDETSEHRLPSVEVFYAAAGELWDAENNPSGFPDDGPNDAGWYYAFGLPGCMWDGEPCGPYESEAEALKAARTDADICEHGFDTETHCAACDADPTGHGNWGAPCPECESTGPAHHDGCDARGIIGSNGEGA